MVTAWWSVVAAAGTLTVDEANALGRPPVSTLRETSCGCIRASYGSDQVFELPVDSAQAVVESAGAQGQIDVWLRGPAGDLKLMSAPCLLAHDYASRLAANLGVPSVVERAGDACEPVRYAVPEEVYHQVTRLEVALADVVASRARRDGANHPDLQAGLMGARGTLAHCFTRSEQTGEGRYRLVVDAEGAITRVHTVDSATRAVDACVVDVLESTRVPEVAGRAWLTVAYAP